MKKNPKTFSLSLLRLDIDFAAALLHNTAISQWEASRPLRENVKSSRVTENQLQTHNKS